MQKGEKVAGIIIFILTIPYGLYALSQLSIYLNAINNPTYSTRAEYITSFVTYGLWIFMGYFSVFLIGIFALPFFRKRRNLILIPFVLIFLSGALSSVSTLVNLFGKSGIYTRLDTVQIINMLNPRIIDLFLFLLSLSIILYFIFKNIRVILPAAVLVISLIVNVGINVVYFTSWYWDLFPEDQIREVGLTSIFGLFLILKAIYFHLIFLLLLIFIKPNYKSKEEPQLIPPETVATA